MRRFLQFLILLTAAVCTARVTAEEAYYVVPLEKLELTEGSLPKGEVDQNWRNWQRRQSMYPYAVLDGEGEVYAEDNDSFYTPFSRRRSERDFRKNQIAVRTPSVREVTGRLFLPKHDWSGYAALKFKIPASAADPEAKKEFLLLKIEHYRWLLDRDIPGGAWFRHQIRQAEIALGQKPEEEQNAASRPTWRGPRLGDVDSTFELFSGGRAISENLQFDRLLQVSQTGEETVAVDSITGITVPEIDWKPLLKDLNPKLDPLAANVPFDQHVVFFPSFNAAAAVSDETQELGGLIFDVAATRSTDARTFFRYQKQLCLALSDLGRLLGPKVIKSMAVTGSDPYFPTGTDVAVLFEAHQPAVLEPLILAQVNMKVQSHNSPLPLGEGQGVRADLPRNSPHPNPLPKGEGTRFAQPIHGELSGVAYRGFRSPDRSICSYVARIGDVIVVTNSPYQLERLADVARGKTEPIAALDEYKFFRSRYLLGAKDETAFLFLSDATIRRWCGPRWRIATSRRTRDAAVLDELQAGQLDRLVEGKVRTGPIYTDLPIAEKGELTLTPDGVSCSALGTLEFMTPIADIPLDRVTKDEAEAYRRWRDAYQRNWRWAFDPIGLRLGVTKQKLSADLTVMPMIWGSDYRQLVDVARGVKLPPDAGDRHDALAQFILAVNKDLQTVHQGTSIARMLAPQLKVDPLGWLGDYVSVYVDDDPFWAELAKVEPEKRDKFLEKNAWRLPIALWADVSSGLKLTAFLTGFRAFVEQTSPGMTNWESLTYRDQPYVKITPTERALGREKDLEKLAVCYAASGDGFLLTLNEPLLKRSIDRQLARQEAEKKGEKPPQNNDSPLPLGEGQGVRAEFPENGPHANPLPKGEGTNSEHPWLGESLCLQARHEILECVAALVRREYQQKMQARAWSNLPILNEWKRRYPNEDPVKLHARFWQTELVCPGGGKYVWNAKWQTMESTVYGHPGAPKEGPPAPPLLESLTRGDFGLTFEEQGLRAKVILAR
ncbi:MAG: hypothetical protein JXB10_18085 [Pirellulales bacterium]|nr:hypothetical protein [Pirellulales bacterium]